MQREKRDNRACNRKMWGHERRSESRSFEGDRERARDEDSTAEKKKENRRRGKWSRRGEDIRRIGRNRYIKERRRED